MTKTPLILTPALLALAPLPVGATFIEVSQQAGLVSEVRVAPICNPPINTGGAWADFDADGDVDLFVPHHGGRDWFYRNEGDLDGDGTPNLSDVAGEYGLDDPGVGLGAVFVDYDNDGDQDLHVLRWRRNSLYKNLLVEQGVVTFADVTQAAGLAGHGRSITAAWADFDGDSHLDAYVATHAECFDPELKNPRDVLYRSNGDGTFSDVTPWLCDGAPSCPQVDIGLGFAPGWLDYDNDGDLDLYVVNDDIHYGDAGLHYPNILWRNDGPDGAGGWSFTDVSEESGTDFSENGMGLGVGDVDNDGDLDMAFSNIGPNYLLVNQGDGTFKDVAEHAGVQRAEVPSGEHSVTWGTVFFDHDNDSLLDLFFAAGRLVVVGGVEQPSAFFRNNGDGTFSDISTAVGLDHPGAARHASIADFDADGFVDLFVANYGEPPLLYRNAAAHDNRWLTVTVQGTASNRDAIGSRLWLDTADGVTRMWEINSGPTLGGGDQRAAFFGLGPHTSGELRVRWPDAAMARVGQVAANQRIHLVQPRFLVLPLVPGQAGVVNTLEVAGATPNAEIVLVRSATPGMSAIPGCDGISVSMAKPQVRDHRIADADGRVTLTDFVPPIMAGRVAYFQVVDRAACAASNRLVVRFPDDEAGAGQRREPVGPRPGGRD